jgi:hypothetical protein
MNALLADRNCKRVHVDIATESTRAASDSVLHTEVEDLDARGCKVEERRREQRIRSDDASRLERGPAEERLGEAALRHGNRVVEAVDPAQHEGGLRGRRERERRRSLGTLAPAVGEQVDFDGIRGKQIRIVAGRFERRFPAAAPAVDRVRRRRRRGSLEIDEPQVGQADRGPPARHRRIGQRHERFDARDAACQRDDQRIRRGPPFPERSHERIEVSRRKGLVKPVRQPARGERAREHLCERGERRAARRGHRHDRTQADDRSGYGGDSSLVRELVDSLAKAGGNR